MNKKLFLLIFIPVFFLFACTSLKDGDVKDINKELEFKLNKVQLTKTFQQIEPFATFSTKAPKDKKYISLLVSGGLLESSGLKVNKIVRKNNELNIYIENIINEDSELAIPQAIVSIDAKEFEQPDKVQLKVIGDNLSPINIKILYNDVISIVDTQFKLSNITTPQISLLKSDLEDTDFVWSVKYDSAFDKSNKDINLISFDALIDANSGKIIDSQKILISEPLDKGNIVGLYSNRYLIYKIKSMVKDEEKEDIWVYDEIKKEKTLLFSSKFQTSNLHFSPNNKYLSFIETGDKTSNLYIVPDSKNAYRVPIKEDINPVNHTWIDDSTIGLIENKKGYSKLYKLDIKTNEIKDMTNFNTYISNLIVFNNMYLYTEFDSSSLNNDIYITNDFNDFSLVGSGHSAKFLNKDTIVYMESKENTEENIIHFHNLKDGNEITSISGLIPDFQIIDNQSILYPEKSVGNNNYDLKRYNVANGKMTNAIKTTTPKVFFNKNNNSYFINLNSPIENDINMLIYNIKP